MGTRKMASRYKHRNVRKPGMYRLAKKEPKFKEDLTPFQAFELEQNLGAAYVLTAKGIAALMQPGIALQPLDSRTRRTSLVGFAPEETEEE